MKKETTYTFSDSEIVEAIYNIEYNKTMPKEDFLAVLYGAKKWIAFKEDCRQDPSYQWGYGYTYY